MLSRHSKMQLGSPLNMRTSLSLIIPNILLRLFLNSLTGNEIFKLLEVIKKGANDFVKGIKLEAPIFF